MLPEENEARQSYDLVAEEFGPGFNGPIILTGTIVTSTDPVGLMNDLADDVESLPGVETVALATPNETADTGHRAARARRRRPTTRRRPSSCASCARSTTAGSTSTASTSRSPASPPSRSTSPTSSARALIPFGVFVVGLSLVLLTIVFRSIAVPIKAALGYLLSVAAAFGVVAAVFEWGWLAELLHVTRTGPIISFMPIVLMGVLFGLAMDYEVFLVSRMREDYVHARKSRRDAAPRRARSPLGAIKSGFTSSARVVTAAALIMFAVFAAFVPEGDASLKPIALGLAVGIVIDAFLVRMTLTPGRHGAARRPGVVAAAVARAHAPPLRHRGRGGRARARAHRLARAGHDRRGRRPRASASAAGDVRLVDDVALRVERGRRARGHGDGCARPARAAARARGSRRARRAAPASAGTCCPGREAWVRAHVGVALLDGLRAARARSAPRPGRPPADPRDRRARRPRRRRRRTIRPPPRCAMPRPPRPR